MHDAHRQDAWEHTASLMALIANAHSAKERFARDDFDPYAQRRRRQQPKPPKVSMGTLKGLFVKGSTPPATGNPSKQTSKQSAKQASQQSAREKRRQRRLAQQQHNPPRKEARTK